MKTTLPAAIKTPAEAKIFLTELHANKESYHPEDNAFNVSFTTCSQPTDSELDTLNKLMNDIYSINRVEPDHENPEFDPCQYLNMLDMDISHADLKKDLLKGIFDEYGNEINYLIEPEGDDGRKGEHYTLSFLAAGDIISEYTYYSKEQAETNIDTLNNCTGIEFNEG